MEGCSRDCDERASRQRVVAGPWDVPPPGLVEHLVRDDCIVSTLRLINSHWCEAVNGAVHRIVIYEDLVSAGVENWMVTLLRKFPCMDTIECYGNGSLKPLADHFPGKVGRLTTSVNEAHEWEMLPKFRTLETLVVCHGPSPSDIARLSTMTTLKELEFRYIEDDWKNVDSLSCLTNLRKLDLTACKIQTLRFVEPLTGLMALNIVYNRTKCIDYGAISALTSLTSLGLGNTNFGDGDASCVSSLINLEKLSLGCTKIRDGGLCHLSHLTKLSHLDLRYVILTENGLAAIAHLTDLQYLSIGCGAMDYENGNFLVPLTKLRVLHMVGLVQNDVMESIVALTCLIDLRVDVNLVTNNAFSLLGNLDNLKTLWLKNSRDPNVVGELLDWGCIPQVGNLALWGSGWVDESLVHLSRMERLEKLTIDSDFITDRGMQHVTKVEKLEHLVCAGRRVSKKCKKKLKERFQRWAI